MDRVADMYGKQLDLVEHDLVSLAEAMPADRYDFRPRNGSFEGVRTFGDQVKHVATMIYMTAAIVLEERSPYGPGRSDYATARGAPASPSSGTNTPDPGTTPRTATGSTTDGRRSRRRSCADVSTGA